MKLILVVLMVLGVAACANRSVSSSNEIRAEILRVNQLLSLTTGQVARAQKDGFISIEREAELLEKLDNAATAMQIVRVQVSNGDRTAGDHLQQARDLLTEVKSAMLAEAIDAARNSDTVPTALIEDVSHDE